MTKRLKQVLSVLLAIMGNKRQARTNSTNTSSETVCKSCTDMEARYREKCAHLGLISLEPDGSISIDWGKVAFYNQLGCYVTILMFAIVLRSEGRLSLNKSLHYGMKDKSKDLRVAKKKGTDPLYFCRRKDAEEYGKQVESRVVAYKVLPLVQDRPR